jgi:uncharacterized membrane protein
MIFDVIDWHELHKQELTLGGRWADQVASFMGSWRFIIIQTLVILAWMGMNLVGYLYHWDPYPFLALNLVFSTQAAYAAPIIMQSQNRQSARDRVNAQADYQINQSAKRDIETLQNSLARIELNKLDRIIQLLEHLTEVQQQPPPPVVRRSRVTTPIIKTKRGQPCHLSLTTMNILPNAGAKSPTRPNRLIRSRTN